MNKEHQDRSDVPGERLFMDISSTRHLSMGGKRYWLLVIDDCTDYSWSFFLKHKSNLPDKMIELIKDLKEKHNYIVKYVRCDNAGENTKFEKRSKQEGLGITMEYTAPGMPQQNGRVEAKFATLYGQGRAALNRAGLPNGLHNSLWAECVPTMTNLKNSTITKEGELPNNKNLYGEYFKWIQNL